MSAFIAAIWNARETRAANQVEIWRTTLQSASQAWRVLADHPGLRIFARTPHDRRSLNLAVAQGTILGTLFDRDATGGGRLTSLSAQAQDEIQTAGANHLLARYWGAYLAIWHGRDGAVHALRDPSGALPCYVARLEGVDLLASDIALTADLAPSPFVIDPQFVQAFVLNNHLATPLTGLKGVSELLPGQELCWRDGKRGEPRWAWNAAEICARPHGLSFEQASQEIRAISERCVADWGKVYSKIAVRLSGGLDSSILLGLLSRLRDVEIQAFHLVGSGYEAQELALARLAASRAGAPLVELAFDPRAVRLESMLASPRFARPTKQILGMAAQDIIIDAVKTHGSNCVVAGHGGDALFLQGSLAEHMLDDRVRLRGLHRDFWSVAFDTAVSQEQPVLHILRAAWETYRHRPHRTQVARLHPGDGTKSLLVRDSVDALPDAYFDNAWLAGAPDLPPGKLKQLESVIALKDYLSARGYGETCEELLPYLSQPILEFALRTPTYVLGKGGVDRSLERHAFANLIPKAVAARTGKGMINHQLLTMLANNLPFVREMLLDGSFIQQGWIVRSALEQALTHEQFAQGVGLEAILNLVAAEVWTRSWRP